MKVKRNATPPEVSERRGVYRLPWVEADGVVVLVAVMSSGRKLVEITSDPAEAQAATDHLWNLLDIADRIPEPRLAVVR